ncbi:hypothetical protein DFP73DRAFT_570663, partial [Morchella snyderi]
MRVSSVFVLQPLGSWPICGRAVRWLRSCPISELIPWSWRRISLLLLAILLAGGGAGGAVCAALASSIKMLVMLVETVWIEFSIVRAPSGRIGWVDTVGIIHVGL